MSTNHSHFVSGSRPIAVRINELMESHCVSKANWGFIRKGLVIQGVLATVNGNKVEVFRSGSNLDERFLEELDSDLLRAM